MKVSPLAGYNRRNWVSYQEWDHFGDPAKASRERVSRDADKNGVVLPEGRIFLLTHLRYLGYNFNPVSFFYCYDREDKLQMVLAEVNNTFGETANYWLTPAVERPAGENKRYRFSKTFHVSPFLKLGQGYDWTFTPPGDRLISQSVSHEDGREIFDSTLKLERSEWSRAEFAPGPAAISLDDREGHHGHPLAGLTAATEAGARSYAFWRGPIRASHSAKLGGVMASGITTNVAKKIFLKSLARLRVGSLEIVCPEYTYCFG